MDFASMQQAAKAAHEGAKALGFDHLEVSAVKKDLFGVRIAQSAICRENVAREHYHFSVSGLWQSRSGSFDLPASDAAQLPVRLKRLREDVAKQSPDKESVTPTPPTGSFAWKPSAEAFEEAYAPDIVYPAIAGAADGVRKAGLRLTGYVEMRQTTQHTFGPGFDLYTQDHGAVISATVDDEKRGIVGATGRALVKPRPGAFAASFASAVAEAQHYALASENPAELPAGDYTVVLHPMAVHDILQTSLMYGLFDRRKTDEGRTFLSKARHELRFPDGVTLEQTLALPLGGGDVYGDLPFNYRMTPCSTVRLVDDGKIQDLHTSAFWAKERGARETFGAYGPPLHLTGRATARTVDELIASTERGIFVANTWYIRMVAEMEGTLTGMTRDGLFEIRDGKLVRPIKNMRWHENPFQVLARISGITDDKRLLGMARLAGRGRTGLGAMPAVRTEGFHFSSVTKF